MYKIIGKGGERVYNAEEIIKIVITTVFCLVPKWLLLFTSALAAYDHDRISAYIFSLGFVVLIALIIDILTLPVPYKIMDVIAIGIYFMILNKARKCRI